MLQRHAAGFSVDDPNPADPCGSQRRTNRAAVNLTAGLSVARPTAMRADNLEEAAQRADLLLQLLRDPTHGITPPRPF